LLSPGYGSGITVTPRFEKVFVPPVGVRYCSLSVSRWFAVSVT
jgi:hypothetical protein